MDPVSALGLISSVGAIASGAVKLAQTLNLYYEKTRRAESDVRAIALEVEQSASVLEKLADLLDGKQRAIARHHNLQYSVEADLKRCQELFAEIREALLKVVRIIPTPGGQDQVVEFLNVNRSLWPMKQQRIEVLRSEMRHIRTELHLVVAVSSFEILLEDHQKRLEDEEEQLKLEDDQLNVLNLEAQVAAQRYRMLERRREKRIINQSFKRTIHIQDNKPEESIRPSRQNQEELENLETTEAVDIPEHKRLTYPLLGITGEEQGLSTTSQTEDVTKPSGTSPTSTTDSEIVSDPVTMSNDTALLDTASDPSLLDYDVESSSHPKRDEAPGVQSDQISDSTSQSDSISVIPTHQKGKTTQHAPLRTHDVFSDEAKTRTREPTEEPNEATGTISFVRYSNEPKRYESGARETWIIQTDSKSGSHENRWRNIVATQAITTLVTKRRRFLDCFTRNESAVDRQLALTITQRKCIMAVMQLLQKDAAEAEEKGYQEIEGLELVPKGKTHDDITAIKITVKWQSREESANTDNSIAYEADKIAEHGSINRVIYISSSKSETQANFLTRFKLGRWRLMKVGGEEEAATKWTPIIQNPIEYPGHPRKKVQFKKWEHNEDRRPHPEDFGIPGLLHRPTLLDHLRGRTGICKECVRHFKKEHVFRFSREFSPCSRCMEQYGDKYLSFSKANRAWNDNQEQRRRLDESETLKTREWERKRPVANPSVYRRSSKDSFVIIPPHSNRNFRRPEMSVTPYRPSERALEIIRSMTQRGARFQHD